ncbi:D-alanyl-D-alanine carboxypeptidase family protein [Methylomicrobium sp. RS1]|uniref:D-alanyl-D-alanine carboxypeptidase family protein n=1 Tax=Candidatus Methylomicrobium oryzae TaxID=2802053 RepID=UPI001920A882|nr:D-alanyl-D-alanine carboxypeptidase family protein [Methylomicrobium sp. RS1]MBL1262296.1 D-alanyl-D-alanine carboxypeptidase [Methylomicrobium sp. RS1]
MRKVKSFIIVLLTFGALLTAGTADARYAAILIDAENGNVLHEIDATHPWYPASLTKVMTLYMAFEALAQGRIGLHDGMSASYHASRQPQSKLGLRAGETLTVEEAILAVITRSANDAAVVLGEHLGGTEEAFAGQMTAKARQLGMYNTRFMNATGLPNNLQVTTSRDLAILAWKIMKNFPNYYPYFASHGFSFKGRELRGINKFTARYPGAEGMKTGFTCGSGFNLMSSALQNGKRLIGIILGGSTSAERYQLMMNMMDAGFSNRYGDGSYRNIDMMTASAAGEPPYQLDCGNHHGIQVASAAGDGNYHRVVNSRPAAKHYRAHKRLRAASGYHRLTAAQKAAAKRGSPSRAKAAQSKRGSVTRTAQKTAAAKKKAVKPAASRKTVKKTKKSK